MEGSIPRAISTAVLCLGLLATFLGLLAHGLAVHIDGGTRDALLIGFAAAGAGLAAARWGAVGVATLVASLAALMFGLGALAALLTTAALVLVLGLWVYPTSADSSVQPYDLTLGLLVGAAFLVAILQPAARFKVNWSPVYLCFAFLVILAGMSRMRQAAEAFRIGMGAPASRLERIGRALLLGALVAVSCYAVTPEQGFDALFNHLTFAQWMQWNGRWHFDPEIFERALMPRGAGLL